MLEQQSTRGRAAKMRGRKNVSCAVLLGVAAVGLSLTARAWPQVPVVLSRVRITRLQLPIARVDQVLPLPNGGFAIRSSDFRNEQNQAIQLIDAQGRFVRKIGSFGRAPGQYFRLTSIGVLRNGILWATDLRSRVMLFNEDGNLRQTFLIQSPGYDIKDLSLDEERGVFYLAGCLPTKTYLDLGCQLVHEYSISAGRYIRSFLETDPEAIRKRLLALENYHIDRDATGEIFAVDAPLFKLFVVDPRTAHSEAFPVVSKIASPVSSLETGQNSDYYDNAFEGAFLLDTVQVVDANVIISIRRPHDSGYVLEVLCKNGRQVSTDVQPPGRLVGKGDTGNLYFAWKDQRGLELGEFSLRSACTVGNSSRQH
jgi:hypothetical protein